MTSILMGYSVSFFDDRKIFIKHFGPIDSLETDYQYNLAYEQSLSRGLKTEKDKLEELEKDSIWTKKEDEDLNEKLVSLTHLKKTKSKSYIPSQVQILVDRIKQLESEYVELKLKRDYFLRHTAEKKAERRAEDFYIYNSFFYDKQFNKSFFSESFDDVDSDLIEDLKRVYIKSLDCISNGGIRNVALTREFLDLVYMAEKPYEILGKPYVQYTYYQTDLINLGRLYKHILSSDPSIPEGVKSDPDKLETWWETSQNAKKILERSNKSEVGNSVNTLVGVSSEDLKAMYGDAEVVSLDKQIKDTAAKSGKTILNMQEMMKMKGF